jgi:hypothetical protein
MSGPALTTHGSLDLKQEIQIQIQMSHEHYCVSDFTAVQPAVFPFPEPSVYKPGAISV